MTGSAVENVLLGSLGVGILVLIVWGLWLHRHSDPTDDD
jgi:hypothetical protein